MRVQRWPGGFPLGGVVSVSWAAHQEYQEYSEHLCQSHLPREWLPHESDSRLPDRQPFRTDRAGVVEDGYMGRLNNNDRKHPNRITSK